jgi:hypothetical protein
MKAKNFYLILRGPKGEHHNAPFHPVILCTRKHTAEWESKRTKEGATVWVNMAPNTAYWGNWLLVKYKGYDIDYGHLAHYFTLFDGKDSREVSDREYIEPLLRNAIWWSYDEMPEFVRELGVRYAEDQFTKDWIWEDLGDSSLGHTKEMALKKKLREMGRPIWLNSSTTDERSVAPAAPSGHHSPTP